MKRIIADVLVSLLLVLPNMVAAGAAPVRPNILFIMSDDHASHAMSCYGSRINKTPNMDRIAATGMRFSNCFVVNSICTPSRAAILTGKYSHMNGVTVFNPFDGSQQHLAKLLRNAGYQTAVIGKWHLFSAPTGFDYWNVLPGQGRYHDPQFIEFGKTNVIKGYVTDIITDLSIQFLERRDPGKPFLLMTHHKAPHREWSPDAKHEHLFDDVEIPAPVTFDDDYKTRSRAAIEATMRIERDFKKTDLKQDPPADLAGAALKQWKYQRYIKDYLRCIASVDDNIGRLLDYLDKTGLRTNTIVIYTSDQGFFLGEHGWFDKRFMYEESLRMPLLVSVPGMTRAGSLHDQMVLNVDFAPTLLDLAGVPVPPDMQGRSIVPLFRGEKPKDWRTAMYYRYYHYPADHRVQPHYGIRTEQFKLIYFNRINEWELFDLKQDPYETNNLYADPRRVETVAKLKGELARLKKEVKDEDQFADVAASGQKLRPMPIELALRYDGSGEGETVRDLSENHLDGKFTGAQRASGRKTHALKFDGRGAVSFVSRAVNFNPAGKPFAIGAWCRPEAGDGVLVSVGGGSQGFSIYLKEGTPHVALRSEGELFELAAAQKIETGQWAHITGALNSRAQLVLLINGREVASAPAAGMTRKPQDAFVVGADSGSRVADYATDNGWRGSIEDLRVYWGDLDEQTLRAWAQ
jgi:arylsulfatase A-like enzyme